jgi:hypothetical protein
MPCYQVNTVSQAGHLGLLQKAAHVRAARWSPGPWPPQA